MIEFLKRQIGEKDKQINSLLERDHETNVLIQGLQAMVFAVQPPQKWQGDNSTMEVDASAVEFEHDAAQEE